MEQFYNLIIPVAHAQTFAGVAGNVVNAMRVVIPILFLAATIVFLAGVIMYITAGGEEDKHEKGRKYIIWGLIGLFVMVAVWGIVKIIISLVFGTTFVPTAPQLPSIPGAPPFPSQPSTPSPSPSPSPDDGGLRQI